MARLLPCGAVSGDLLGLNLAEGSAVGFLHQGRAHEVHAVARGLLSRFVRPGTPPNTPLQTRGLRENGQRNSRFVQGGVLFFQRRRSRHSRAADGRHEQFELLPGHVGAVGLAAAISEGFPSALRRLGRTARNAERHASLGDEVQCRRLFREIEGIFVAQVDDARAHFDVLRRRRNRRENRHGRGSLGSEMVDAEVCAVDADLVRGPRELDLLAERLSGERPVFAVERMMAEAEESE